MRQQASIWRLHEGLQLCGLGVGGDELPDGCGGAPGGTVNVFTSPGPASPAPDRVRLHYTMPTAYSMLLTRPNKLPHTDSPLR